MSNIPHQIHPDHQPRSAVSPILVTIIILAVYALCQTGRVNAQQAGNPYQDDGRQSIVLMERSRASAADMSFGLPVWEAKISPIWEIPE